MSLESGRDMECLKAEGLSRSFGSLQAVQEVSLSIGSGERRAIIGPNGAGKTTLFNLFTGELQPTAGRLYLFGEDITHMPTHKRVHRGMARTYQVLNLIRNLSVLDNVRLAVQATTPYRFGMFSSRDSYSGLLEEAKRLLDLCGLWDRREERVQDLSYGQQRHIELIMAMASRPRILLLDEPTSGLSEAAGADFVTIIGELGRDTTLVVIEHDTDVVFELADMITVLHRGQVVAEGTTREIRSNRQVREIYLGEHD